MTDVDTLLKRKKPNFKQLVLFGFTEKQGAYVYSANLFDEQFEILITVSKQGGVSTEVIEKSSGESYVLHLVCGATGAFVGRVREEYERVLGSIAKSCFEPDVFKSEDAKRVIQYVKEKYNDELEFLWERFPNNAIFRRKDNAKWYAAILTVQQKKLGLKANEKGDGDAIIEVLDLRMKPEDVEALVDGKKYLPGFHMNKKHWITICLNGSVALEEIFFRIDESFELALK